jgi:hypothetical protein
VRGETEKTAGGKRAAVGRGSSMEWNGCKKGGGSGVTCKQLREGERADIVGAETGSEREAKGCVEGRMGKVVGRSRFGRWVVGIENEVWAGAGWRKSGLESGNWMGRG